MVKLGLEGTRTLLVSPVRVKLDREGTPTTVNKAKLTLVQFVVEIIEACFPSVPH